jgi:hypothetical protein
MVTEAAGITESLGSVIFPLTVDDVDCPQTAEAARMALASLSVDRRMSDLPSALSDAKCVYLGGLHDMKGVYCREKGRRVLGGTYPPA